MKKGYDYCITGATGLVGSNLVDLIVSREPRAKIVCLVRKSSNVRHLETLPVETAVVDFNDSESMRPYVTAARCVYHLIGLTASRSHEAFLKVNRDLAADMFSLYRDNQVDGNSYIFMSSLAAVGPREADRKDPLRLDGLQPITDYGRTKLLGEKVHWEYLHKGEYNVKLVRAPSVYGKRDRDMKITFDMARKGVAALVGRKTRYITVVNVEDLAAYLYELAGRKHSSGIYYPYDGTVYTQEELLRTASRAQGRKRLLIFRIPLWVARTAAWFNERFGKNPIFNREKVLEMTAPDWGYEGAGFGRLGIKAQFDLYKGVKELYKGKELTCHRGKIF